MGAKSKNFAPILLPKTQAARASSMVGVQLRALLIVADVARRLSVCEATVYKLCARGTLAHIRILNAVRISPEAVEEFARKR